MKTIFYKGQKLARLDDETRFIDHDNKLKCDLFNDKGAILAKKGQIAPKKLKSIPIYTYISAHEEFSKLPASENASPTHSEANALELFHNKKKKIKQEVGEETFTIYSQTTDHLENVFAKGPDAKISMETALDMVEENYKHSSTKLFRCVQSLRSADTYTAHHSYSVYLIFQEALYEFKKHINRDDFWDAFKVSYASVSFNDTAIKTYAAGALMHDLGKAYIPLEILNKPGELTKEEFEIMKTHPRLGIEALTKSNIKHKQIQEIVANHHSRYPFFSDRGQSALTVIANIVDIFDACKSERCYKPAFSWEETLKVLEKERQFANWGNFIYQTMVRDILPKFI